MTEITELEGRISGALDRIATAQAARAAAERAAHERIAELEAELMQARDAAAAATTAPDPAQSPGPEAEDTTTPALQAELDAARSAASEASEALADSEAALAEVAADLDSARAEAAQLRERLVMLEGRDRLESARAGGMAEALQERVSELEAAMTGLRQVNGQLRQNNAALRDAHAAGLPDAGLINAGLQTEIDALRAARAADRAEIDSVLAALQPLLQGEEADA